MILIDLIPEKAPPSNLLSAQKSRTQFTSLPFCTNAPGVVAKFSENKTTIFCQHSPEHPEPIRQSMETVSGISAKQLPSFRSSSGKRSAQV